MSYFPSLRKLVHFLALNVFLADLPHLGLADPPYSVCSNITTNATNSQFQNNLDILLSYLSSNASTSKQFNASSGKYPDRIYGQYMCLNYMPIGTCASCVKEASEAIKQACQSNIEATERQEFCQLRYSRQNFIGHLNVSLNTPQWNPKNISSNQEKFSSIVNKTINDLVYKAALDPNFYATGERAFMGQDKIYALVQCTTDISPNDCETCLRVAFENVSTCYSSARGVRIYSFSCYLRYELYGFYNQEPNPGIGGQQTGKGRLLIPMVALAVLVVVIFGFIGYWLSMKRGNAKQNNQKAQLHIFGDSHYADQQQYFKGRFGLNSQESPFIGLEDILEATDNFSESNKLGEGGFGPVYKGALSNGKEVAVKRLSIESEQGTEEFTNEVLLIMKLQHKNLVRLLGFCIDGQEKLLVYEFMPNRSLDVILFDRKKRAQLDWGRSINIIHGIARGILYLHQDSPLRIIHRDLKASNILLDSDMNPKISDFGMARIYGGSEGTTNTSRIVGTYGYMSPEYAMEGLYSIKSDVFSFGVLLLEIITGRRNMGFHWSKRAPSLIAYVWELWMASNPVELKDPLLNDSCPSDEFLRYMHIGLLCVQQDAGDRPTMPTVVSMLRRETAALPQPQRPAFSIGTFTDHYEMQDNSSFVNELTITDLLPR